MKRVGLTESRPEDENFKTMLENLNQFKTELREIYKISRNVTSSGKKFHDELEKFCGLGLRSEQIFFKETEFLNTLGDRLCSALGTIVGKDFDTLTDLIGKYKTAKLDFDSNYHWTVKKIRKLGGPGAAENEDEIMQTNSNLPGLHQKYILSKDMLCLQRDLTVSQLAEKVGQRLLDLRVASGGLHHQIFCMYIARKLLNIAEIIAEKGSTELSALQTATIASSEIFAQRIKNFSFEGSSEASSLISGSFSQLVRSRTKKNNGTKNRSITHHSGNGVTVENKEETQESLKINSIAAVVPLEGLKEEPAVEKLLENPKSNRTKSTYQVVNPQETSLEDVNMGVVG